MFYDKSYITNGFYPASIVGADFKMYRFVLQKPDFIVGARDVMVWDETLPDAIWDDSKVWKEN